MSDDTATAELLERFCLLQFRHKSDNHVNNRQSQVLIRGS